MLTNDLINTSLPFLQPADTVAKALQLTDDFRVTHLPVVDEELFLGMIGEEDLLDVFERQLPIAALHDQTVNAFVPANVHFLNAVNVCIQHDMNIVSVVNEGKYIGSISTFDLLKRLGTFAGAGEIAGIIELQMDWNQFHLSEISRIVESNNCTILHLNSTLDTKTGILTVTLHVNKREISSLISTFQRYEYNVTYSFGQETYTDEISDNYRNLMNYIGL